MLIVSDYSFVKKHFLKSLKKISKKKLNKKNKVLSIDQSNLKKLNQNGYCVVKNVFSKDLIDSVNLDFEKQIKKLKNISIPRDLRKQKKNMIYESESPKVILAPLLV